MTLIIYHSLFGQTISMLVIITDSIQHSCTDKQNSDRKKNVLNLARIYRLGQFALKAEFKFLAVLMTMFIKRM